MPTIRNIIFDLGGLFIDIHMERLPESLSRLTGENAFPKLEKMAQTGVFNAYEKGVVSTTDFLSQFALHFGTAYSPEAYTKSWNAMLGEMQLSQLEQIQPLRERCQIVLLSNTNDLHVEALESAFTAAHGFENLEPFFDKVYYSQRIGLRKPDAEIFDYVLQQHGFTASESLFIDDTAGHLEGAKALGLNTLLHQRNADLQKTLLSVFSSYK